MDWDLVIERNRETLKRVVASLAAMAEAGCRGQFTFFPQKGAGPQDMAQAEKSKLSPAPTLPRHLHRAVLRLLRPAEAAARRLVIVAAQNLVVTLAPVRPRKPGPASPRAHKGKIRSAFLRNGVGTGIILPADVPHAEPQSGPELRACRGVEGKPRRAVLPLFDPPRHFFRVRRRTVPPHRAPRILSFDGARPRRLPPPPAPNDLIDATRLALRLQALHSALDDLPRHAKRFARWEARRDAAGAQTKNSAAGAENLAPTLPLRGRRVGCNRISPFRPGRPPGLTAANRRRPSHEVHEVLLDLHYFAREALQRPDTS